MNNKLEFWKKENLDPISPSFCAAKWKQSTIYLQNGHTHSCHHPSPHKVPLAEIKVNPGALHNTNYKKEQRKLMLEGQRPPECDYCWRVEDNNMISDRTHKSMSDWAAPYIPEIVSQPWNDDVVPSYIEVSFGHVCNFKCSYCSPHISSQWMDEIEQHGSYPTVPPFNGIERYESLGLTPIPNNQDNPYVDAFWEWWPSISDRLEQFRITGGEPLLNKNTFKFLDYIIDNPHPNLTVSINSNMCPPDDLLDKFIDKIKIIIKENRVKECRIFTSAEAWGAQAEYIRFGMDYNKWLDNINKVLTEIPGITFTVMSTYNALSVPSYITFLKDIYQLKQNAYNANSSAYPVIGGNNSSIYQKITPVLLDIPYLRWPQHQNVFILPKEFATVINEQVQYMYDHLGSYGNTFSESEAEKLKRIYNLFVAHDVDETVNRTNFKLFVDEHDRRRGTNFLETFPDLAEFYKHCSNLTL